MNNLPSLPVSFDFVGALKAGGGPNVGGYALYNFNDFLVNSGVNGGTWKIAFTNGGKQIPDISHMMLFVLAGDGGGGGGNVPEPGSLALLGLGLAALSSRLRRSRTA